MKKITKILSLITAYSCLFFGITAMASKVTTGLGTSQPVTVNKEQKVNLMFLIKAKSAKLTHVSGTDYRLTIPISDINTVLAFSDRPERTAFYLKPNQYADLIDQGSNSFKANPPNIAVSFQPSNYPGMAFKVNSYKKNSKYIAYSLRKLSPGAIKESVTGHVSLFFDGIHIKIVNKFGRHSHICIAYGNNDTICSQDAKGNHSKQ